MTDLYQLLGVAPNATAAQIRQAYLQLARTSHPDRFSDPAEKQKAAAAFAEITAAFNALANPRSRQEYDAGRSQPAPPSTPDERAAEALERARGLIQAGSVEEAVAQLRVAVHLAPADARYRAALGRALARQPGSAREAVQQLEQAAAQAPNDVALAADLASLLVAQGLKIRAGKVLAAARRIAPGDSRLLRLSAELGLPETP